MTPSGRRKALTAEEAIKEREERLRNDPEYRAQVEAVEAERRARVEKLRQAERPIVRDLRAADVDVNSVWDLVNTSEPYPSALPILLDHLEKGGYPDRVMESLGRALAVKPTVAWWDRLKVLYLSPRGDGEQEGTAVALAACATKAQLDDLLALLSVEEGGGSRIYFLLPIKRLGGAGGPGVAARGPDLRQGGFRSPAALVPPWAAHSGRRGLPAEGCRQHCRKGPRRR